MDELELKLAVERLEKVVEIVGRVVLRYPVVSGSGSVTRVTPREERRTKGSAGAPEPVSKVPVDARMGG